jgi:hypothetical protein
MSPCQPIAPLGRPSEGGLTGSPDAGRCSAGAAPSSPSRRRRRRVISSARLSAPSRPALRRGTGRHCPHVGQRARAGKVLAVTCTFHKQPECPLSFTVPSCGAAQGRLPERPKGAVCKTVGLAYVGSNPTPATTCGNGPWPGVLLTSRAAALGPLMSRCVHASPAASGCARTYSGQRPGWTSGPPNRLSPRLRRSSRGLLAGLQALGKILDGFVLAHAPDKIRPRRSASLRTRDLAADSPKRYCRSAVRLSVRAWRPAPRCSCQRPGCGPRWWPVKSPHSSG